MISGEVKGRPADAIPHLIKREKPSASLADSAYHSFLSPSSCSDGALDGGFDAAGAADREAALTYGALDFIRHLTNFRRSVPSFIDAFDGESRRMFQHFSRYTTFAFF